MIKNFYSKSKWNNNLIILVKMINKKVFKKEKKSMLKKII